MRENMSTVERTINVLIFLAKEGPSTIPQLMHATGHGKTRTNALLIALSVFGLVAVTRDQAIGARWWQPGWVRYKINNIGRHYLQAFDELDPRAPFAAFEEEGKT